MISAIEQIQIYGDPSSGRFELGYTPQTNRTLFDICDFYGRILKTGEISGKRTLVEITDLSDNQFIILVLDGDRVCSRKLKI